MTPPPVAARAGDPRRSPPEMDITAHPKEIPCADLLQLLEFRWGQNTTVDSKIIEVGIEMACMDEGQGYRTVKHWNPSGARDKG